MTISDTPNALSQDHRGFPFWLTMLLAGVIAAFGIWLFAGGIWLIGLGGSWYYAIAGAGLLVTAFLMGGGSLTAVWAYLATYVFTLIWALWESGLDGWAQVPRLLGPTIVLLLVLATIPVLRKHEHLYRVPRWAGGAALAVAAGLGALNVQHVPTFGTAYAQQIDQDQAAQAEDQRAPNTQTNSEQPISADNAGEDDGLAAQGPAEPAAELQPGQMLQVGENWPAYGGSMHATRYSPLDQITADNVTDLRKVWEYRWGDMPEEGQPWSPENTPLKVGDDLYICTPENQVIAVDARTGSEEWRFDPGVSVDAMALGACRGVAYYEVPDADPEELCATRIISGTQDSRLIALDAKIGQPCPDFGLSGEINLEQNIGETVPGWYEQTSAPTIVRGVVVVGGLVSDNEAEDAPSGVVRAFDAVSGEFVWAWDLGNPGDHDQPAQGETYTRGTPNFWTNGAADEELGLVYLPLGNSAVDYYGSNRSELENEYATSLVAVDATTGEEVWHFQTVINDVWDYDLGSQPSLVDFPGSDGETIPAIVFSSKQGEIYLLNRETGEPLFEPEMRDVPQGGVEPDYLADQQPFSTFASVGERTLEGKDMWGISPLDQLWCRIKFHQAYYQGQYTPPTQESWYIQYPGWNGGSDWGSLAVDEDRGILIANYNNTPNYNKLLTREEADAQGMQPITDAGGSVGHPQIGAPYAADVQVGFRNGFTNLLCKQPPYGGIKAIDLATGETLWDRPFGTARANGPFGIPSMLPVRIGTPNNGGPIITASGLVFIAATTDNLLHAIDIETGDEVWSTELPAGGQATPITFEEDGRQYIALVAGGHASMQTPSGDYLIAWALPLEQG